MTEEKSGNEKFMSQFTRRKFLTSASIGSVGALVGFFASEKKILDRKSNEEFLKNIVLSKEELREQKIFLKLLSNEIKSIHEFDSWNKEARNIFQIPEWKNNV